MITLSSLTPINLLSEKEKVFADPTYNPQFVYEENINPAELAQYGQPDSLLLETAQEIVTKAYQGKSEAILFEEEGRILTQEECTHKIAQFLEMHQLEDRIEIIWSASFISRASATSNSIKLRLPVDFHLEGLLGMIYHELGTHTLRRVNYEQQPWFKRKKKHGFRDYLITEEGLASLHSLLPHSNKSAFNSALRYLAVSVSQHSSFAELWQFLAPYIQNPERRWIVAFRQKRGLTDTSQPGGFDKDQVYFQGMNFMWQWLTSHNYDLRGLYFGKLAAEDIELALQLNPTFEPLLPSFYTINPELYAQQIQEIGQANLWDQVSR